MASYVCDDTDFNKFYFPEPLGGPAPQDPPVKKRVKKRVKKHRKRRYLGNYYRKMRKKCKKAIFQINDFLSFFGWGRPPKASCDTTIFREIRLKAARGEACKEAGKCAKRRFLRITIFSVFSPGWQILAVRSQSAHFLYIFPTQLPVYLKN